MHANTLLQDIEQAAVEDHMPDGEACRRLDLLPARECARMHGLPLMTVELTALENGIIPQRYARNFKAFSIEKQLSLLKGAVMQVGLGGLGGALLELLARAGVGRIIAADGDVFEESNCNRQLLCTCENLGTPKSDAAAQRVQLINPAVECLCLQEMLDGPRMLDLIRTAGEPVVVLDALGGLESRPALWQAAQQAGAPMVTAAVAGASGCVGSFFPGDTGPELLFGSASSSASGSASAAEDALGTQGPGVHLAACLQAQEAIRLLGDPDAREGRVLFFDLSDSTFERVRL